MMRRYLASVGTIVALLIGSVATVNYFVDPLLLYHHRGGSDEMLSRIDQFYNMRLYKPYHVSRLKPQAIIIGTSRSLSIRPDHSSWEKLRAYNFALPGMTVYEISREVKHAQAVHPLSRLIIGLDYDVLVNAEPKYRRGFEPDRLLEKPSDAHSLRFIGQWIQDQQAFLFSSDMLRESIVALFPPQNLPRTYYSDGAWKGIGKALVGRGGYIYVARSAINSRLEPQFRLDENLPYLRDLLHFCYRNNIDTTFFFTPTHVFFVDLWYRITSERMWYETHREVLKINAEIAREYGKPPFDIWGFGDEAQVVAEPIYRARDIDKAWFKDGVHYGTRLAEAIMDALLGSSSGFGQKLTSENIDRYLEQVNSIRRTFLASNEKEIALLHRKTGNVPDPKD